MIYNDCPNCKNDLHNRCETNSVEHQFICTCSICNALAIHRAFNNVKNQEEQSYLEETLEFHVENMTKSERTIYVNRVQLC